MTTVDLSGWAKDERFSPYPEGSRDKYAVIAPPEPSCTEVVPNHRYLMKFSNPRYPVQFWSEIIAAEIGNGIGVPVPPCYYAEDADTKQPGSLSEWFFGDAIESGIDFVPNPILDEAGEIDGVPAEVPLTHSLYVAGSNYMARLIHDYDLKTGRQHSVKGVGVWIKKFSTACQTDFWPHWIRMFTFDGIIGNTDRHQDNWGVLWRSDTHGNLSPRFAPAFDNGTSLLHEIVENNLVKFSDKGFLDRYINRGTHHVRWDMNDPKPAPHLGLIKQILDGRPQLTLFVEEILDANWEKIFDSVSEIGKISTEVPISEQRLSCIFNVISRRVEILKSLLS